MIDLGGGLIGNRGDEFRRVRVVVPEHRERVAVGDLPTLQGVSVRASSVVVVSSSTRRTLIPVGAREIR